MLQQIFLIFLGLCAGTIVAGGTTGLLIGLSIVPRYAGITHTADHILLYEDMSMLGTILGNLFFLFRLPLPAGNAGPIFYGLFSGIFLGGWILALAEIADIIPIFARRIRLTGGIPLMILSMALGKAAGSLLYYYRGWQ